MAGTTKMKRITLKKKIWKDKKKMRKEKKYQLVVMMRQQQKKQRDNCRKLRLNKRGGTQKNLKDSIKILERKKENGQRMNSMESHRKRQMKRLGKKKKSMNMSMRNLKAQWMNLVMKVRLDI